MSSLAPLGIVIPVRDEASRLPALLADLAAAPADLVRQVWVVDGGSGDASALLARLAGARLLRSPPGRGRQLAVGAAACDAPWLLLLHADVRLPPRWGDLVRQAMERGPAQVWAFPLAIEAAGPLLGAVGLLANLRSRWRHLPYGDQGLLVERALYRRSGGVAPLPLMEDLDLVLRLRRLAPILLLPAPLQVDGRRWRRLGVLRAAWGNAALRRAWRRGVDPADLAALYYGRRPGAASLPGWISQGPAPARTPG